MDVMLYVLHSRCKTLYPMKRRLGEIIQQNSTSLGVAGDFIALTKPRLLLMVLVSCGTGFYLALTTTIDLVMLIHVLIGTTLIGAAANCLNQCYEAIPDSLMERTQGRPIPSKKLSRNEAGVFGIIISIVGFTYLTIAVNWTAVFIGFLTWGIYLFIYTPMKQKSVLNTWAGSVVGALPPLIGWAASGEKLGAEAWTLFAILYFWQFPHFFALSWMYKEDYQKGGFRMLSFYDETGKRTGFHIISNTLILALVSLAPFQLEQFSWIYLPTAILLGLLFVSFSFAFHIRPSFERARQTFRYSIAYLPLLLLAMILDKAIL